MKKDKKIIKFRNADIKDFRSLYDVGLKTPELRVSATEKFMDLDDFRRRIKGKNHVFILAEVEGKTVGFISANAKDADSPLKNRYACLVYLVVLPGYRKLGIATKLHEMCMKKLKAMRITHVYAWADTKSGIIKFMKKKGFKIGKPSVWVDKKI